MPPRAEKLPRLPPEIGSILAGQMARVDQYNFRRAIMSGLERVENLDAAAKAETPYHNVDSIPFLDHLARVPPVEELVRSLKLFNEYCMSFPQNIANIDPLIFIKNAPIRVVRRYRELVPLSFAQGVCSTFGRYDILKWQLDAQLDIDPLIVHNDVSPEALDSVYRSYSHKRNDYASLLARHLRLDALKLIQKRNEKMGQPSFLVAIADVNYTDNESKTIRTMQWLRDQGMPWTRQLFRSSLFQSLKIVQWINDSGYVWRFIDWWSVFHNLYPLNISVVHYLMDLEIEIPDVHAGNVSAEIDVWADRQKRRWKAQLESVEALQGARPHEFPVELLLQAPAQVVRLQLEHQEVTPEQCIIYDRYDLLTPEQLAAVHRISLLSEQANDLDKDTLVNIYNVGRGKDRNDFVAQLMAQGRVDVLENIDIPEDITIFRALYKNINTANTTIQWALSRGMQWGIYWIPENMRDDPIQKQLISLFRARGAHLPPSSVIV